MEKCLAGEWYDCHAPVFLELKGKTHRLLMRYNSLSYEQKEEKYAILKEMFGSIGTEVSVGHSFLCDYGCNIHIGDNVTVNIGCVFVDCNKITVGNNVLIAPNVQIYTATHPIDLNERLTPVEAPEEFDMSVIHLHFRSLLKMVAGSVVELLYCPGLLLVREVLLVPEVLLPKMFLQTVWLLETHVG